MTAGLVVALIVGLGSPASALQNGATASMAPSRDIGTMSVPAVPTTSDHAIINVQVRGDRIAGNPLDATGVAGVVLRLSSSETDATTWQSYSWASCTSDADGDCNFIIPIVSSTGISGMKKNEDPWVHQISAPAGYYLNPTLYWSGAERQYRFQFKKDVKKNTTYYSTSESNFMVDNNSETGSSGFWQVSRTNPPALQECGLDYAVLMDLSSSMSTSDVAKAVKAIDTFVDALRGTPSRLALFTFDGTSPAVASTPNVPTLRSVRTAAEAALVKTDYHAWQSDSGTNWDAGLYTVAAAAPHYDAVLMITDGDPYGFGTVSYQGSGNSNLRGIEAGVFSANLLKAEGTRIVAFGVGGSTLGMNTNLKVLSGPALGSDYFVSDNFDVAAGDLAELARGNCDGTITVNKRVISADKTIPANATQAQLNALSAPADGWEISASTTASGTAIAAPGGPWVTDAAGIVTVPLSFTQPTTSGAVTVTETMQDDFAHQPVTSAGNTVNAVCTNSATGAAVSTVNYNSATTPGFTVTGSTGVAIDCTIYNRETTTQQLTLVKAVSFGTKATTSWTLSATAPTGSAALAGPTGTHSTTTAVTGEVSANIAYTLAESGGPATYQQVGAWACVLTDAPSTAVAVTSSQVTMPAGDDVTCTVTNATAALTLLTHVVDGDGSVVASDWALTATPATMTGLAAVNVAGAEYAAAGNPSSTFEVRPGHSYTFTDALVDPATPLAYRLIRIELRNPNGSWSPIAGNQITAPAAGQTATYRFVHELIPPVVLPLTGGASSDRYFIAGGIILIVALGTSGFSRRRRRIPA